MPPFIGYEDMSGVFNCGPLFEMGGEAPPLGVFYYTTLSLSKKSRKEMASLCKNGQ